MQYFIAAAMGFGIGILSLIFMMIMKKREGLNAFTEEKWYQYKALWIILIGMPLIGIYLLWLAEGFNYEYGVKFMLAAYLIVLCIYDTKYRMLPDICHVIYFVIFLVYMFFAGSWYDILNGIFGVLLTLVIFGIAYLIKKDQFGIGDVKVLCVCAFLVGVPDIFYLVFRGLLLAAIFGIIKLVLRKAELKTELPLVPFLLVGVLV